MTRRLEVGLRVSVVILLLACDAVAATAQDTSKGFTQIEAKSVEQGPKAIPLPPALLLFGSGIVGLGLLGRRRTKRKTPNDGALPIS